MKPVGLYGAVWFSSKLISPARIWEFLKKTIHDPTALQPAAPHQIAEHLGKDTTTTRRLIQKLAQDGLIVKEGKYYTLSSLSSGNSGNERERVVTVRVRATLPPRSIAPPLPLFPLFPLLPALPAFTQMVENRPEASNEASRGHQARL